MKSNNNTSLNLLDVKPVPKVEWETCEDGKVTLLIPRFGSGKFVQWFIPKLSRSRFRLSLDEHGSFLWKYFDGETPISDIAPRFKSEFGEAVEPLYERINKFISVLEKQKFIEV